MFFLLFLLDDRRIWILEAQKHTDPDQAPEPQHWFLKIYMSIVTLGVIQFKA
jgi:hypothetical protein